jgi:hypothetical protein
VTQPATATDELCAEMARTIVLALTAYGPAVRLVVEYAERGDGLEVLHDLAGTLGLELLAFVRMAERASAGVATEDGATAAIPLARVLGESLAILGLVHDRESARRLPMASFDEIERRYDSRTRAWLRLYVDKLPERQGGQSPGDR